MTDKMTLIWETTPVPRKFKAMASNKWEYNVWQNLPGIGSNHCFWEWGLSEVYLTYEEAVANKTLEYIYQGIEYQTEAEAKDAAQEHCDEFFKEGI